MLAKPVHRHEFLIGKYLGLVGLLAVEISIMFGFFLGVLVLKGSEVTAGLFWATLLIFCELALITAVFILVRLVPGDRAFTIDFAALTFAPGPALRYRYRLEGLNADWIESGEHSVTYAVPPPGDYRFQVQTAAGSESSWSEPGGTPT